MKNIYSLLLFIFIFSSSAFSQQYEWAKSNNLSKNLNPSYPGNIVCNSGAGTVFSSHTDSSVLIYGTEILAPQE
ncbi:MAG: hypothetical protein ABIO46_06415 [Chitinophagales bacterium]